MVASVLPQKLYRGVLAPGTTTPTFRVTTTPVVITSTNSVSIPTGTTVQVGDVAVVIVNFTASATSPTNPVVPAGWTLLASQGTTATQDGAFVYAKTITTADRNTNVVFTWTSNVSGYAHMVAYSAMDIVDALANSVVVTFSNYANLAAQPDAASGAFSGAPAGSGYTQYTSWYGASNAMAVTTAPAGMTNRLALVTSSGSLVGYDVANGAGTQSLTWSVANNGIVTDIRFFGVGPATSTLYTVPALTRTSVTNIVLTNTSSRPGYVTLLLSGTTLLANQYLAPMGSDGAVVVYDLKQVMLAGEVLAAGGPTWVAAHISGAEMT